MTPHFTPQENQPQPRPSRRAPRTPISRAEKSFAAVCGLAMLCLGAGVWLASLRGEVVTGATVSAQNWRLAQPRVRMASALVGKQWWLLSGIDSTNAPRGDAETFDLSQKPTAHARGVLASTTLLPRNDQTAQASGRDIYIFGGLNPVLSVLGDVEKLDTRTGIVTSMAPMPTPRRMPHSILYRGKIYVVGGSIASRARVNTLEIYDIATDTWSTGAPMSIARECDVALWNGQILALGGYNGDAQSGQGVLSSVESYDIATGKWRALPGLSRPISAHHTIVSGDWVFLFGDYLTLSRVLAYNARTGVTRELPASGFTPRRHVEAVAYQGRVYIAGGNTDDKRPPLGDVQVFDLKKLRRMAEVP